MTYCIWRKDNKGLWHTGCGNIRCPFCGREIRIETKEPTEKTNNQTKSWFDSICPK